MADNNNGGCYSVWFLPDFNENVPSILVSGLLMPVDS